MSAGQLAPGPWYVSEFERSAGGVSRVVMGADGFSIAHVMDRSADENEAIASLIAVTHELLGLMRRVRKEGGFPSPGLEADFDNLERRIARAAGSAA